ncbi:hypothetical protein AXG93_4794s1030 [Marchantia polymorpha subsp. ruderalis]|uniref:Uncharacterized protein n=1 Tax=Marchantia polymorpha subsp. ruderalis TaxID=1480154 RepID=A0A176VGN9_MARPO|nr:hypothetical protein AXG93_4794s1030 [Marchantia polymorpha subsp. ruderalis]
MLGHAKATIEQPKGSMAGVADDVRKRLGDEKNKSAGRRPQERSKQNTGHAEGRSQRRGSQLGLAEEDRMFGDEMMDPTCHSRTEQDSDPDCSDSLAPWSTGPPGKGGRRAGRAERGG